MAGPGSKLSEHNTFHLLKVEGGCCGGQSESRTACALMKEGKCEGVWAVWYRERSVAFLVRQKYLEGHRKLLQGEFLCYRELFQKCGRSMQCCL